MMTDDELRREYATLVADATRTITEALDDALDDALTAICDRFTALPDDAPITLDAQVEVADNLLRLALIDTFAARDTRLTFAATP